ncbi:DUF3850 domain-containing protein [Azospirillum sp.]|uniref:DUF3850 domain-containing protein n=1 Tax=Azospirillum sp. TaxID=34012 RepID=UPI002D73F9D5|nr:DUF3850 domain-containing protein [Azospirillum sp.]HYF89021.1 DUF3850 domain-containing protein [Azospirillum sp.]
MTADLLERARSAVTVEEECDAPRIHELKADPTPFSDLVSGRKRAEVRRDDRGFQVGDKLFLCEFDRKAQTYSGRQCCARVTHIQRGYGLPEGLVVLSVDVLSTLNVVPDAASPDGGEVGEKANG